MADEHNSRLEPAKGSALDIPMMPQDSPGLLVPRVRLRRKRLAFRNELRVVLIC